MKWDDVSTRITLLAVVFIAMLIGFQSLITDHLPNVISDPNEDMSFAWGVPLFSLYVLYVERKKLLSSLGSPSLLGAVLTLPCLFVGFLGVRGIQIRLEIVAFAGLCITIPWAFFGWRTAKRMLFPAAFLLFCLPLATFLDVITVHLRLFATSLAFSILEVCCSNLVHQGTMIIAADGSFGIDVAEPCSGLRSIFALMALTAGYAYFNQSTWLRRALLFASSVPLAILGNVARILTICIVGCFISSDLATGFVHDYSGILVFLVAISLMLVVSGAITRGAKVLFPKADCAETVESSEIKSDRTTAYRHLIVPGIVTAIVIGVMASMALTPETTICEAPAVALGELDGYTSELGEASESELQVLPDDTHIERRIYTAADGRQFVASLVIGGKSKSSIHRPELCLPSQGNLMRNPHTVNIGGTEWRMIALQNADPTRSCQFAYTFFNQDGFETASHVSRIFRDVLDRSLFNRIDRWAMVTVVSPGAEDVSFATFLSQLKESLK